MTLARYELTHRPATDWTPEDECRTIVHAESETEAKAELLDLPPFEHHEITSVRAVPEGERTWADKARPEPQA